MRTIASPYIMHYIAKENTKKNLNFLIKICLFNEFSFEVLNGNEFYMYIYDDLLKDGYYNTIINHLEPAN